MAPSTKIRQCRNGYKHKCECSTASKSNPRSESESHWESGLQSMKALTSSLKKLEPERMSENQIKQGAELRKVLNMQYYSSKKGSSTKILERSCYFFRICR